MPRAPAKVPAVSRVEREINPLVMINSAVASGAAIETMKELMLLQERYEDRQARKEFFRAMADFQAAQPSIVKLKQVAFNDTEYKYAPIGDIAEQIREALHNAGLSYRFEQRHEEGFIEVTCIVSHYAGHEERTSMRALADASGKKNAVQAIGSTVTYLQRYTLTSALGITTADTDMDARLSGESLMTITEEQAADLKVRLQATSSNVGAFLKMLGIKDIDAMPASKYSQADKELSRKEAKLTPSKEEPA